MAEVILMPRLSDTMTEGVIGAWHKNVGDAVAKGDLLADIETDKATMELESYQNGVLLHIGSPKGGKLQVNDLLAIIGKAGEDVSALVAEHGGGASQKLEVRSEKLEVRSEAGVQNAGEQKSKAESSMPDAAAMEEVVLMPRLSDTMTEGVIAAWHKNVGDAVKKGEVLADIETDKATMELESYKDGKLLYQGAKAGEKIAVNDLLCIIGKDGFDVEAVVNALKSKGISGISSQASVVSSEQTTNNKQQTTNSQLQTPNAEPVVNEGRIFVSPLAKKMADEKGIDLKYVKGSGDNGRIIKSDIENWKPSTVDRQPLTVDRQLSTVNSEPSEVSFTDTPVSQMRKTIARRLSESMFTAPHFYLTMSIDMDACVTARGKINEVSKIKISFNDMVLKAVAAALKQHPKVNSSWMGDFIRTNNHVNIGVAVAVDEGLLVPVVRNADQKSLSQIATEVKDYAQKAKDKKLQPSDWEGNTFTISNLGMFGIDEFTAIINPPDACILAIGGIAQVPVVKNGAIIPGNVMKVTLSCDHRVVDGATGSAFLQTLKSLLEEPLRMMV